jgi:hypothetical protein
MNIKIGIHMSDNIQSVQLGGYQIVLIDDFLVEPELMPEVACGGGKFRRDQALIRIKSIPIFVSLLRPSTAKPWLSCLPLDKGQLWCTRVSLVA